MDKLYKAVFCKPPIMPDERSGRVLFLNRLEAYLTELGRTNHLVHIYYNDDDITVVLNNRDTALMLKLALA